MWFLDVSTDFYGVSTMLIDTKNGASTGPPCMVLRNASLVKASPPSLTSRWLSQGSDLRNDFDEG